MNKYKEILTDKIRIYMIDLVKGRDVWYPKTKDKLSRWSKVLTSKDEIKKYKINIYCFLIYIYF